jgi:hypothetical protein
VGNFWIFSKSILKMPWCKISPRQLQVQLQSQLQQVGIPKQLDGNCDNANFTSWCRLQFKHIHGVHRQTGNMVIPQDINVDQVWYIKQNCFVSAQPSVK